MSTHATTIITPEWLLTLESDQIIEGHSVVIENDCITDILENEKALNKYPEASQITLNKQVLMPGLINCHGHTAMNLFKGMADDLPLMTWLEEHI